MAFTFNVQLLLRLVKTDLIQYNPCNLVHLITLNNTIENLLKRLYTQRDFIFTVPTVHQHMLLRRVANLIGSVQSDSKLLSWFPFIDYVNPENNLESPCSYNFTTVITLFVLR
jgi:hypothetical protein